MAAPRLTEEVRYDSQINIEGAITMTEFRVILKDGSVYIKEPRETTVFVPGDAPESLPGYGPILAQSVWTAEIIKTYAAEHPEEVAEPAPELPEEEPT